jgi:hypothetical protein
MPNPMRYSHVMFPNVNHAGVTVQQDGSAEHCLTCGQIPNVNTGGGWAGLYALCARHYAIWAELGFRLTPGGCPILS